MHKKKIVAVVAVAIMLTGSARGEDKPTAKQHTVTVRYQVSAKVTGRAWPEAHKPDVAPRVGMDYGTWRNGKPSGERIISIESLPCGDAKATFTCRPGDTCGPRLKAPKRNAPTRKPPCTGPTCKAPKGDLPPVAARPCEPMQWMTVRRWWPAALDPYQAPEPGMDYGAWTTGKPNGEIMRSVTSAGPCRLVRETMRTLPAESDTSAAVGRE